MKFYYCVYDKQEDPDDREEYSTKFFYTPPEYWLLMDEIAKDFYNEHDGWDHSWPLDFFLWDDKHEYIGKFIVEIEHKPSFFVREVNDETA